MKHVKIGFNIVLLGALLTACGGAPAPTPTKGTISGTVGFAQQDLQAVKPALKAAPQHLQTPDLDFVPGRLLVKFRSSQELVGGGLASQGTLKVAGKTLSVQKNIADTGIQLLSFDSTSKIDTLQMVSALSARSDVEYVQPDYLMSALKTPNDDYVSYQWHYQDLKLPQAWDITTGANVTVAVVDTGILGAHPDLSGKLLPGYDFVTDAQNAGDGNGRDANPEDEGSADTTGYHGTHVAGTIAARSDNKIGVAGVSWGAKVLPVRVLGLDKGSLSDILDGISWAAGYTVAGVPKNPNPAQVINLSLGGKLACTEIPAYEELFAKLAADGKIVVVAAGNSNIDASEFSPASCHNVITVGATQYTHQRASYSNFGGRVDVMAPGGEMNEDLNGDQYSDGVLSLVRDDSTGQYSYEFMQGTSMAAPHVAGVVALMKGLRPSLTTGEALQVLQDTATPISNAQCRVNAGCGAGLVNAYQAVKAVSQNTQTPDYNIHLDQTNLTLNAGATATVKVQLELLGGFQDPIAFSLQGADGKLQTSLTKVNATTYQLQFQAQPDAGGTYQLTLKATSGQKTKMQGLTVQVKGAPLDLKGTWVMACAMQAGSEDCDESASSDLQINSASQLEQYQLSGIHGYKYAIMAWQDRNKNGQLDDGDAFGIYSKNGHPMAVDPGSKNVNLQMGIFHPSLREDVLLDTLVKQIRNLRP